ncbi:hypothetical protein AB834_03150 [PVC group bacterium (ex Bugula neritina AB1)]|nr:hypothetical protein AB834_03150 [PVC group bacterium (ex Bugula neritina AB1)]
MSEKKQKYVLLVTRLDDKEVSEILVEEGLSFECSSGDKYRVVHKVEPLEKNKPLSEVVVSRHKDGLRLSCSGNIIVDLIGFFDKGVSCSLDLPSSGNKTHIIGSDMAFEGFEAYEGFFVLYAYGSKSYLSDFFQLESGSEFFSHFDIRSNFASDHVSLFPSQDLSTLSSNTFKKNNVEVSLDESVQKDSSSMGGLGGLFALLGAAGAVGGGGGSSSEGPMQVIKGSVILGPVTNNHGLILDVFDDSGSLFQKNITIDEKGEFSFMLSSSYQGLIWLDVADTSSEDDYYDEATGLTKNLSGHLRSVTYVGDSESTFINVNPLTDLVVTRLGGELPEGEGENLEALLEVIGRVDKDQLEQVYHEVSVALGLGEVDLQKTYVQPMIDPLGENSSDFNAYGEVLALISSMENSEGKSFRQVVNDLDENIEDGKMEVDFVQKVQKCAKDMGLDWDFPADPFIEIKSFKYTPSEKIIYNIKDNKDLSFSQVHMLQGRDADLFEINALGELRLKDGNSFTKNRKYMLEAMVLDDENNIQKIPLRVNVGSSSMPHKEVKGHLFLGDILPDSGVVISAYSDEGDLLLDQVCFDEKGNFSFSLDEAYQGQILLRVHDSSSGADFENLLTRGKQNLEASLSSIFSVGSEENYTVNVNLLTQVIVDKMGDDLSHIDDYCQDIKDAFQLKIQNPLSTAFFEQEGLSAEDGSVDAEQYLSILKILHAIQDEKGLNTGAMIRFLSENIEGRIMSKELYQEIENVAKEYEIKVDFPQTVLINLDVADSIFEEEDLSSVYDASVFQMADMNLSVLMYRLVGEDAESFTIDESGKVYFAELPIQDQGHKLYRFNIVMIYDNSEIKSQAIKMNIVDSDQIIIEEEKIPLSPIGSDDSDIEDDTDLLEPEPVEEEEDVLEVSEDDPIESLEPSLNEEPVPIDEESQILLYKNINGYLYLGKDFDEKDLQVSVFNEDLEMIVDVVQVDEKGRFTLSLDEAYEGYILLRAYSSVISNDDFAENLEGNPLLNAVLYVGQETSYDVNMNLLTEVAFEKMDGDLDRVKESCEEVEDAFQLKDLKLLSEVFLREENFIEGDYTGDEDQYLSVLKTLHMVQQDKGFDTESMLRFLTNNIEGQVMLKELYESIRDTSEEHGFEVDLPQMILTHLDVPENTLESTVIYDTTSFDMSEGEADISQYFLMGQDAEHFIIDSEGKIYFKESPDYELDTGYRFNVVMIYDNSEVKVQSMEINVLDQEEANMLEGQVFLGPILEDHGLHVEIYNPEQNLLGSSPVDKSGAYKLDLPRDYIGPVLVKMLDATEEADYLDEATLLFKDLDQPLRAVTYVSGEDDSTKANITPLTEIAVRDLSFDIATDQEDLGSTFLSLQEMGKEAEALISDLNFSVANAFGIEDVDIVAGDIELLVDVNKTLREDVNEYGKVLAAISALEEKQGKDTSDILDDFYEVFIDQDTNHVLYEDFQSIFSNLDSFLEDTLTPYKEIF